MDRLAGAARRQRPRGVSLPVLMLPANLVDLGRAVTLGERADRRAGLDRLQLLGVADETALGPCPPVLAKHAPPLVLHVHPRHVAPNPTLRAVRTTSQVTQ